MNTVGVCISKGPEKWWIPEIPFYCHTGGYKPILHHDNNDLSRITYLNDRYNRAIELALAEYPDSENLLIVDRYYLSFVSDIRDLIETYNRLNRAILGASIWYWERSHLRPSIRYYDILSVRELRNGIWHSLDELPTGLLGVSGVGGCFLCPRAVWESSNGFFVPYPEPQAGGSRCLKTDGYDILLDCDRRLWRTHADNSGIPDYPLLKRLRVSLGELRRELIHR